MRVLKHDVPITCTTKAHLAAKETYFELPDWALVTYLKEEEENVSGLLARTMRKASDQVNPALL